MTVSNEMETTLHILQKKVWKGQLQSDVPPACLATFWEEKAATGERDASFQHLANVVLSLACRELYQ